MMWLLLTLACSLAAPLCALGDAWKVVLGVLTLRRWFKWV